MKMSSGTGKWLKSAELKTGDTIKILNEGEWQESTQYKYENGDPKKQCVFSVEFKGEEFQMSFNKGNREALCEGFGDESKDWIGKEARVEKVTALIGGKRTEVVCLTPIQWED